MKCRDCPIELLVIEEASRRCGKCEHALEVQVRGNATPKAVMPPVVTPQVMPQISNATGSATETKQAKWARVHPDHRRRINREGQARRRGAL